MPKTTQGGVDGAATAARAQQQRPAQPPPSVTQPPGVTGPIQNAPVQPPTLPQPVMVPVEMGVTPTMQGSLPEMASGADRYFRQFYRSGQPVRRFLPVSLGR